MFSGRPCSVFILNACTGTHSGQLQHFYDPQLWLLKFLCYLFAAKHTKLLLKDNPTLEARLCDFLQSANQKEIGSDNLCHEFTHNLGQRNTCNTCVVLIPETYLHMSNGTNMNYTDFPTNCLFWVIWFDQGYGVIKVGNEVCMLK